MEYMDNRIKEFFGFCKNLGIKCFLNIAEDEYAGKDEIRNSYKIFNNFLFSVTEYREEGHNICKVYGYLDQELCDKIMGVSANADKQPSVKSFGKEYCLWDGKQKYKDMDNVEIVIH
jgi:hypothetical protein